MGKRNACGSGYCSVYLNPKDVADCISKIYRWNGVCAYQDGRRVPDNNPIVLDCCADGCLMLTEQYIRWNGLCAYIRKEQ